MIYYSFLKEEVLDLSKGWQLPGNEKKYNIEELRTNKDLIEAYKDKTFYPKLLL